MEALRPSTILPNVRSGEKVSRLGDAFGPGYLINDALNENYADVNVAGYVGDELGDEVVDGCSGLTGCRETANLTRPR